MHERSRFKNIRSISNDEPLYRIELRDRNGQIANPVFSRREIELLASKSNHNKPERNFFREALTGLDKLDANIAAEKDEDEKVAQEPESSAADAETADVVEEEVEEDDGTGDADHSPTDATGN